MEKTLYATRAIAENDLKNRFDNYTLRPISNVIVDDFNDDDSLCYLGSRSGECSGYDVEDENGNLLAVVAWWEEGGDYKIRVNGKTVQTATYWSLAMHIMKELAEAEEDKEIDDENYIAADIDCVIDGNEVVNVKEL